MPTKGFTLIELIIVMAIIAIMSAVIVLNVNSSTYSKFISDANKISSLFNIIADEAVYTDSVINCNINSKGLECQKYKDSEWNDMNLSQLTAWQWPNNIKISSIIIDGNKVNIGSSVKFYPNTNLLPFSIQITDGVYNTWIDGDINGNFEINN